MVAIVAILTLLVLCTLAYGLGVLAGRRGERVRGRLLRRRPPPVEPQGRPIEAIARDLRRLATRYHGLEPHTSFVKVEAVTQAYDRVLGECCDALGVAHLLGVLGAGPGRNAERERVEAVLGDAGVRLPHAA